MKYLIKILIMTFVIVNVWWNAAQADRVLRGEVLLTRPSGDTEPAGLVSVVLAGTGKATVTDDLGQFVFDLPPNLTFGKTLTFRVQKTIDQVSWRIWNPIDGKIPLPRDLFVTIKLLPKGSKKFWTDQFIEYYIAEIAEEAKRDATTSIETPISNPKIPFGALIKEWANEYGFTLYEAKQQIDQWGAEVKKKQENFYKLGLAFYVDQEFVKAAEWFSAYGDRHAHDYKQLIGEAESHRFKAVQGYWKAGTSLHSHYRFQSALKKYKQALALVKQETEPDLRAEVLMDIGRVHWAMGVQAEDSDVGAFFEEAKRAYLAATKIFESLGQKEGQARAQVGLANVLAGEANRVIQDDDYHQLALQALTHYHEALLFFTKKSYPQNWARIQTNIGNVLTGIGARANLKTGEQFLNKANQAFRSALEVLTRKDYPDEWGGIQNNLGIVLNRQGMLVEGDQGRLFLVESISALELALAVRTHQKVPQDYAATKNNLGDALRDLGNLTIGKEGRPLLRDALSAYRSALDVYTQGETPFQWALTLNNMGLAQIDLCTRFSFQEGQPCFAEAITAFRQALLVRTYGQFPRDWAETQMNLGMALAEKAIRTEGDKKQQLLKEAEETLRAVFNIVTGGYQLPIWPWAQHTLGIVLREQGLGQDQEKRNDYLINALETFRQVSDEVHQESHSALWIQTHEDLAITARYLGKWKLAAESYEKVLALYPNREEAAHSLHFLLHDKLFAYQKAYSLISQWVQSHPTDILAQTSLAEARLTTGKFVEAEKHLLSLLEYPELSISTNMALRMLVIATFWVQEKDEEVPPQLRALRAQINQFPKAQKPQWDFSGTKHFIQQENRFMDIRDRIVPLLEAMEGQDKRKLVEVVENQMKRSIAVTPKGELSVP